MTASQGGIDFIHRAIIPQKSGNANLEFLCQSRQADTPLEHQADMTIDNKSKGDT